MPSIRIDENAHLQRRVFRPLFKTLFDFFLSVLPDIFLGFLDIHRLMIIADIFLFNSRLFDFCGMKLIAIRLLNSSRGIFRLGWGREILSDRLIPAHHRHHRLRFRCWFWSFYFGLLCGCIALPWWRFHWDLAREI